MYITLAPKFRPVARGLRRVRPRRLIAIGNDAYRSVKRVSGLIEVTQVRHPSYGGQARFIEQMRS